MICLDVANGYNQFFVKYVEKVREAFPKHTILVRLQLITSLKALINQLRLAMWSPGTWWRPWSLPELTLSRLGSDQDPCARPGRRRASATPSCPPSSSAPTAPTVWVPISSRYKENNHNIDGMDWGVTLSIDIFRMEAAPVPETLPRPSVPEPILSCLVVCSRVMINLEVRSSRRTAS